MSADHEYPPAFRLAVADPAPVPDAFRNAVVAIGSFDGVHLGHQALIARAAEIAAERGTRPVALTFDPHPRRFFQPDQPMFLLSDNDARRGLLGIAGADGVVEAVFDAALAALEPTAFIDRVLVELLAAEAIVVGENFRFGRGRAGDVALLRSEGSRRGFAVEPLAAVTDKEGEIVSSGRVRDALRVGDVDRAEALLGYRWFVTGTVAAGDRRGRLLGYPTANIVLPEATGLRFGVYAVTAHWHDGAAAEGVASFGVRPVFGGGQPILETHLFDFDRDLYGTEMAIRFHGWLREERDFPNPEALIVQMDRDAAEARSLLRRRGEGSRVDRTLTDWF